MKKGEWYLKQGRTSAITFGKSNGAEADINHSGCGVRSTQEGSPYVLDEATTREVIILSHAEHATGDVLPTGFSHLGDSGSFVIDTQGKVCGLLYAEHIGHCSGRHDTRAGSLYCSEDNHSR